MQLSAAILQAQGLDLRNNYAQTWPELPGLINSIFARIAKLPFVPSDWLGFAQAAQAQALANGGLVQLYPAIGGLGLNAGIPAWLKLDDGSAALWQDIYRDMNAAVAQFAAGKAVQGAAALQQLRDNAAYWNKVAETGSRAADKLASGLSTATTILIVGGAVALLGLWWYKDPAGFRGFWSKLVPGRR